MAHAHYTLLACILEERPAGEANLILRLLTKEFGLIDVAAQSVRVLPSKLRYQLGRGRWGRFTVVRGREYWRLVGAEVSVPAVPPAPGLVPYYRMIETILRLVRGEGTIPAVYAELAAAATFLNAENADPDLTLLLFQLRALRELGYLPHQGGLEATLTGGRWSGGALETLRQFRGPATAAVDEAFYHNHL